MCAFRACADDSSTAQREAMLAAVRAQGAQLMSLQKVPTGLIKGLKRPWGWILSKQYLGFDLQ